GLRPRGVCFHVGSQQLDPAQWKPAIAAAASVFDRAAAHGVRLDLVDIGGGFPAGYLEPVPPIDRYAEAGYSSLAAQFEAPPQIILEPGRFIVADAGVLLSEVVLVSTRSHDASERWVYLDVGIYGGLAEAQDEIIRYPIVTSRDGGPCGPVILAGPTCDSTD